MNMNSAKLTKNQKPAKKKHRQTTREKCEEYETKKFDWKINQNDLHTSLHCGCNVNRMRFKYNLRDLNR